MLWIMFTSSFLAATLLPGGSELLLAGLLKQNPNEVVGLVIVASLGNTLGALTSYWLGFMGRKVTNPKESKSKGYKKALKLFHKYGYWSLLLSWAPIIGDFLCVFAGLARCKLLPSTILILIGKTLRYVLVALVAMSWL